MRHILALLLASLLLACVSCTSTPPESGGAAAAAEPRETDPGDEPRELDRVPVVSTVLQTTTIGHSVRGEPIEHRVLGFGPTSVLLIGLIHGDEAEGYDAFEMVWSGIDTPEIRTRATVHGVPSMNPDGHARSSRWNARGVDLNRNWPSSNFAGSRRRGTVPLSEPETRAVHALLESVSPDLIIVFHSTGSGPFVDPDGPGAEAAAAFVDAAAAADPGRDPAWRIIPDYTNPPGSLGTYAGMDLSIPTLTVEFDIGHGPSEASASALAGVRAAILSRSGG